MPGKDFVELDLVQTTTISAPLLGVAVALRALTRLNMSPQRISRHDKRVRPNPKLMNTFETMEPCRECGQHWEVETRLPFRAVSNEDVNSR